MAAEKIDALELNIESKLSVENLDKLIESLRKLGKEVDKVKDKKPKEAVKGVGDGANEAANGIDKFLGKTVRIAAVIALFRKSADVISDCVSSALSYNKTLNMFTVSLGEYAENATKYGETVNNALGIDIAGWQKTQGIFQTLITGFGVGGDQAAYMSQNLTQLSYDIASFHDLTTEEAANKIKSAIAGRLEPIRGIGYDLSQSKLVDIAKNPKYYGQQTFAINEQTGAIEANTTAVDDNTQHKIVNFNQLTQQEKVQLRYIALMTQETQVQGNFAKTLSDPNNQLKIFKEQLSMTSRELGNVFIPALNQVLPYLTAFTQLAGEAFRALASLFGFELPDMSDRMDISSVAEPYNDVVQATGRAAGNAKKLKDYMLGIDELNVLNPNTGAGGGGGGVSGQNSNLNNLLTPGYDFLSKAVKTSIKQAKEDIKLLQSEFQKHPITFPAKIIMTGMGELGSKIWEFLLGKTPDELGIEAAMNGNTVAEQFCIAFYDQFEERSENIFEVLFGSSQELGERAAKAGRDVGKQFSLEFRLQMLEYWGDDPLIQALYGGENKIKKDKEKLQKAIAGDYSGGGRGGLRTGKVGGTYGSSHTSSTGTNYAETLPISKSLGNTAADEARKQGERVANAYAEGLKTGTGTAYTAGANLYISGVKGANYNGQGGQMFYNTSANEAYKFAMGLTSPKAKADTTLAGKSLAAQGTNGAKSLANDSNVGFNYAGQMSGKGYIGGLEKYKSKASSSGRIIAEAALNTLKKVLGIHSPSTAYGEQAKWSVLGYANYMEKYSYLAENAAKKMATSALQATQNAGAYTSTNVGYGIGMANQGAMMNLAGNMYNAIVNGLANVGVGKGDTVVMIDGKEVFRVVQNEARKSGVAISNGAFA